MRYVYNCMNAVMSNAYIATMWHRGLYVCHSFVTLAVWLFT